uniref:Uncharacterized protein n=1 Tax=Syphacia muris TaxID=451379 RepID=A0A0N5A893_9BILA
MNERCDAVINGDNVAVDGSGGSSNNDRSTKYTQTRIRAFFQTLISTTNIQRKHANLVTAKYDKKINSDLLVIHQHFV